MAIEEKRAGADIANEISEAELALVYKARMREVLEPVLVLMDTARDDGLLIRWDGIAQDQLGRSLALNLRVEKHY